MADSSQSRWRLATCSYNDHRPECGVPVGTSVGPHPAFSTAPEVHALKPFGVFGVMSDRPVHAQRAAYQSRLHRYTTTIERLLDDLTATYPGETLCLLCWCRRDVALRGECHRRWCADWFGDVYGIEVPEVSGRTTAGGAR